MADVGALATNILVGAATGVLTAAAGVQLALHRFRAERLWDRKADAYSEVFDALYHVRQSARIDLARMEEGAEYGEPYLKQVSEKAASGYEALRKAALKGTFVVGAEAAAKLQGVVETFDDPHFNEDWHEELVATFTAVEKAIAELKVIANKDLKI